MPRNLDYPMPMHGRMMRQRLWEAQIDAGMLYDVLRDSDRVPAWTLDKVARGAGDIQQVSRYLRFKASNPTQWGAPAAPASITLPEVADRPFYEAVLRGIGAPVTGNTLAVIYAWRQTEGGKATYNPFNTTWKKPGSTPYGKNTHGVQNYATPQDGVDATVKTLVNPRYATIVKLLQDDTSPREVVTAITQSSWGTKDLLVKVLTMFEGGRVVVNPIGTVPGAPAISTLTPAPPDAPKKRKRAPVDTRRRTNWWLIAGVVAAGLGVVLLPLLGGKSVPSLPAPPKSNPRRR